MFAFVVSYNCITILKDGHYCEASLTHLNEIRRAEPEPVRRRQWRPDLGLPISSGLLIVLLLLFSREFVGVSWTDVMKFHTRILSCFIRLQTQFKNKWTVKCKVCTTQCLQPPGSALNQNNDSRQ